MTSPTSTENLFQLSQELLTLDELLTESGGELTPEIEAWMTEYRDKLADKVDGIGWFIRTCEARAAGYKHAKDDLAAKQRTEEAKVARIKSYVQGCMGLLGTRTLPGTLYTLALQKNGGKRGLQVAEPFASHPEQLPAKYRRVVVLPDLDALRADAELDGGSVVCGEGDPEEPVELARLLPQGESVRLR